MDKHIELSESVVRVRDVSKFYPKSNVPSVDSVSFDIKAGSIVGLLGGNGAGKTTTLSMLLGVLTPTSGSIHVMGIDMAHERHKALAYMNFASPYVDMPYRLTLRENLTIFCHLYNVPQPKNRIEELAVELELTPYLNRLYGSLSAGQKTRAAMAKSLINKPRVLLLDEPTASLDPDTADWVRQYMMDYNKKTGATLILASHNMNEVERMCDEVIMMKKGRIVDRAKPADMLTKYGFTSMEQVFLHIARQLEIEA